MDDDYFEGPDYQHNRDSTIQLLEVWKKAQKYLDLFWMVWREEYLLSLRKKLPVVYKDPKSKCERVPREVEIVFVKDNNIPRSSWKLGKIQHL